MIKSFHIKNFRSCRDVSLDGIGPILALAGRNGAGKTNILEAIYRLAKTATDNPWHDVRHVKIFEERIEGSIAFDVGGKIYRYDANRFVASPSSADESASVIEESLHAVAPERRILARKGNQVCLAEDREFNIHARAPAIPTLLSILPLDDPYRRELESAAGFLSAIRYYPLDEPSRPGADTLIGGDEYAVWLAEYNANPATSSSVPTRLIHLYLTSPELFEELKEIVGDQGLSIISEIKVETIRLPPMRLKTPDPHSGAAEEEPYYVLTFTPSGARAEVHYSGLSLGTRRVLQIIASLLFDQSAVALLEQPEDCIHSGLMKKVIGVLRQYSTSTQIIMASHSANVFNKLNPEEIRLVAFTDGETTVRALSRDELSAAAQYVQDAGPLSDFIQIINAD